VDLHRAVANLPRRQRVAVVLTYFADLPQAEVAVAMGVRRGTVASTLSDARSSLAITLKEAT
jgi:RNA polymerase sigma factor (sigma-70 family)